jgi:hypothetical protein
LESIPQEGLERTLLEEYAGQTLPDWRTRGKGHAPLVLLAKLARRQDVGEVNAYMQGLTPWSNLGSTWFAHKGDYDFTVTILTTLLYLFGEEPDLLYPETREHLLTVLLNLEGGEPRITVPRTLGVVRDTENHILMMESSRYLKNQWLFEHGTPEQRANPDYDNASNGLQDWLTAHLDEVNDTGFYEFNSIPYVAYTMHPLLNLVTFAKPPEVAARARYLIDQANLYYALGSLDLRRCAPFRRQPGHAGDTDLSGDPHSAFMYVWARDPGSPPLSDIPMLGRHAQMLVAAVTSYTLPDDLRQWTLRKPSEYLVRIGRGVKGSPEIYSGGPGYLLSAGGVSRGKRSRIVARPTSLFLRDGARDLNDCIHIRGRGEYVDWNNTGVHKRFACGNGPVHVPGVKTPAADSGTWRVFGRLSLDKVFAAIHSTDTVGLIAVFPDWTETASALALALEAANPSADALASSFNWPDGSTITYDVNAQKGAWVIESVNGESVERDYDAWPKLSGELPDLTFGR